MSYLLYWILSKYFIYLFHFYPTHLDLGICSGRLTKYKDKNSIKITLIIKAEKINKENRIQDWIKKLCNGRREGLGEEPSLQLVF